MFGKMLGHQWVGERYSMEQSYPRQKGQGQVVNTYPDKAAPVPSVTKMSQPSAHQPGNVKH